MRKLKKTIKKIFFVLSCFPAIFAHGGFAHEADSLAPADSFFHSAAVPEINDTAVGNFDLCNCKEENQAAAIEKRPVSTNIPAAYQNDPEFQYERTVIEEGESFWNALLRRIMRKLFGNVEQDDANNAWNLIYWTIAILAVILVCYWLYKSEFYGGPLRRSTKIKDGSILDETDRSEEDIELRIEDALQDKNYPLAIRWIYIKTIKAMASKNEFELRQDKTNHDYYYEIKDKEIQDLFFQLTRLFEYSNYGHFTTTIENFQQSGELSRVINIRCRA